MDACFWRAERKNKKNKKNKTKQNKKWSDSTTRFRLLSEEIRVQSACARDFPPLAMYTVAKSVPLFLSRYNQFQLVRRQSEAEKLFRHVNIESYY